MSSPSTIDIALQLGGKKESAWHIVKTSERSKTETPLYGDVERVEHVATLCGRRFDGEVVEVDSRVVAHAGRPVCGNCTDQLAARLTSSGAAGIVESSPTRSADDRRENRRNTMTTSTRKQAVKSAPLLEPASYDGQTVDRLKAERSTINNRLSGLGTQVKRHLAKHDTEKARAAEDRIADLQARRTHLAELIAAKSNDLGEATHAGAVAAAGAAEAGGDISTAAGRRTNSERRQARRTTAKREPGAKRKTAPKRKAATKRKTATKRSQSKRKTAAARKTK